jgi:hypothetical protein
MTEAAKRPKRAAGAAAKKPRRPALAASAVRTPPVELAAGSGVDAPGAGTDVRHGARAPAGGRAQPPLTDEGARPSGIVTLLTDFGLHDPFVGVMKAVVLSRFPHARIVDVCHDVAPYAVAEGAFWLERSYGWFPAGTVHVAVVDPGVGSERLALAVRAGGHVFVGPDNGLLRAAIARAGAPESRAIDLDRLGLPAPSATFHGRDVFAPVAAELAAARLPFDAVGPIVELRVPSALPLVSIGPDELRGSVATVDRFGNLVTDVDAELLARFAAPIALVASRRVPFVRVYADVAPGALAAVIGSFGTVEIACNRGSAAAELGVGRGAEVRVSAAPAARTRR